CLPLLQPVDAGADNGSGCIKVRFTNFKVNNMAALSFELIRPGKCLKCGFALNSEHAFGNLTFQFCTHNGVYRDAQFKGRQYIIGDMTELGTQDWIRVASLSDIPDEGMGYAAKADGLEIAIFRYEDRLYALEDLCPHLGFPLSEGMMQFGEVIC